MRLSFFAFEVPEKAQEQLLFLEIYDRDMGYAGQTVSPPSGGKAQLGGAGVLPGMGWIVLLPAGPAYSGLRRERTATRMRCSGRRGKKAFPMSGSGCSGVEEGGIRKVEPCGSCMKCSRGGERPCAVFPEGVFSIRAEFWRGREGGREHPAGWNDRAARMRKGLPHEVVRQPRKKNGVTAWVTPCGGASSVRPVPAGRELPLRVPERWRFHSSVGRSVPGKKRSCEHKAVQWRPPVLR